MTNTHRAKYFMLLLAGSGIAAAGDDAPVGRAEAMACRSEIAAYHDSAIKTYSGYVSAVCNSRNPTDNEAQREFKRKDCEKEKAFLQSLIDADDIEWWLKENRTCWSLYACFGPHMYQSEHVSYRRNDMEQYANLVNEKPETANNPANRLDACIAKAWLARNPESDEGDEIGEDSKNASVAASGSTDAEADAKSDPIRAARCAEALAEQDRQFIAMTQSPAAQGSDKSAGGAKALYQMGMYITSQRLEVLDKYCQGEPQYATYAPTKQSYESALNGCRAVSSDGGESCKPLKLW